MITPTPGRVVWYWPNGNDAILAHDPTQPLAAHIARVWSDSMVNLMVIDANGISHGRTSITLVQEGDDNPSGRYCCWMPYQQGQAKAHAISGATATLPVVALPIGTVATGGSMDAAS